jgi:parallel beta-helix repeat protein
MITENSNGIYCSESSAVQISENTIQQNRWYGIWAAYNSSNILIINNSISRNEEYGMYLKHSSSFTISSNDFVENENGIYLENSSSNRITYNNFIKTHNFDAYFVGTKLVHCHNVWHHNYWGKPRFSPYFISGVLKRQHVHIPKINIDWRPLLRPHTLSPVTLPVPSSLDETFDGKILYVGGSGPGNFSTIGSAIQEATNGDTIFVYTGIYLENVIVDKSLVLVGENRDTTIIQGNGYDDVVSLFANDITVKQFTIQGGHFGITCQNYSNLVITDNNITGNLRGASLVQCSRVTISNNMFIFNPYGVRLYSCSLVRVHYNNFYSFKINAFFLGSSLRYCHNNWNHNYWGERHLLPYGIKGKVLRESGSFLWLNFDWRPLLRPVN